MKQHLPLMFAVGFFLLITAAFFTRPKSPIPNLPKISNSPSPTITLFIAPESPTVSTTQLLNYPVPKGWKQFIGTQDPNYKNWSFWYPPQYDIAGGTASEGLELRLPSDAVHLTITRMSVYKPYTGGSRRQYYINEWLENLKGTPCSNQPLSYKFKELSFVDSVNYLQVLNDYCPAENEPKTEYFQSDHFFGIQKNIPIIIVNHVNLLDQKDLYTILQSLKIN